MIEIQRATESRLRATLEAFHPAPLHLSSSLDRDITLSFICEYPTKAEAARVGPARMQRFCARHGYTGRTDPAVLVQRMRPHLLTAAPGAVAGKSLAAAMFAAQLRLLNTQIRAYDKHLDELLKSHPDSAIFLSFPGIGHVVAGVLLAELGEDRTRFPTVAALLAETGLAPVTKASGRVAPPCPGPGPPTPGNAGAVKVTPPPEERP